MAAQSIAHGVFGRAHPPSSVDPSRATVRHLFRVNKSKANAPAKAARVAANAVASIAEEHGFRIPARHRAPIYYAACAVFVIIAVLVYVMAKPDPERIAAGYVNTALGALPEQRLAKEDLSVAVLNLNNAFEAAPNFAAAVAATRDLKERVARQVEGDLGSGELGAAEELITAAAAAWPEDTRFDAASLLRAQLARARETRELYDQIRNLLVEVRQRSLSETDQTAKSLQTVLEQLGLALDALPANEQPPAIRDDVRRELAAAVRESLDSNGLQQAQRLISAVPNNWSDDSEIKQLREEVQAELNYLNRSRQVEELLEKAESSIVADRLSNPAGNNAVHFLRQVLALDPDNVRATQHLRTVADRYAVLVANALETGSLDSARRHVASLERVSPTYSRLEELARRIEDAEAARNATQQASLVQTLPTQAQDAEPLPNDPEGKLWFSVRNGCKEKELRRYINSYPAGRYVDQAWQRISDCLALIDGQEPGKL